jgi:tetratricopeptide (TPR) repeat protein
MGENCKMKNLTDPLSGNTFALLIDANQLREKRDFREAIRIYDEILSRGGTSVEMMRISASCYFQKGMYEGDENDFQKAISILREGLRLDPKNDLLHSDLGQIYSLGILDYPMAAQEYREAIGLNSENINALLGGAALYGVPDDVVTIEEAIDWLTRAISLEPNDPNHRFRLGNFL